MMRYTYHIVLYNLKKFVLSLKYLYEIFDIKEGVLRSNDDLVFNETRLKAFLVSPKYKIKINIKYIEIFTAASSENKSGFCGQLRLYHP